MLSAHGDCIAVEVEIISMSSLNGIPFSIFHPDNPFINHKFNRPLPYWGSSNNFGCCEVGHSEIHWIIEEELTVTPPSLDLTKAFNCFNQVPSKGAKYSLKLCADVPENNNPTSLSFQTDSETGHSFIVVTKSNGTRNVTQVFGFYAQKHPGYTFPFRDVPSTIKNNQLREINASIEMGLTEAQFDLLRKQAFELAKKKYAAAAYNCTNFALDLFNSIRSKPISIETYIVYLPYNNNIYGTSVPPTMTIDKTPQMLFKKLKEMKDSKDTEASNIVIDQSNKTKAPLSHGECDQ